MPITGMRHLVSLNQNSAGVDAMVTSGDGKRIAWYKTALVTTQVIDALSGQALTDTLMDSPNDASVSSITLSKNGTVVASTDNNPPDTILYIQHVGSADDPRKLLLGIHTWVTKPYPLVQLSPDGALIVFFNGAGHWLIAPTDQLTQGQFDTFMQRDEPLYPPEVHSPIAQFTNDGKMLAIGSNNGTTALIDPGSQTVLRTLRGDKGAITAVVFDAGGDKLAVTHAQPADNSAPTTEVYQTSSGQLLHTFTGNALDLSGDGQRLLKGPKLTAWDVGSGKMLWSQEAAAVLHFNRVAISWRPGQRVAARSESLMATAGNRWSTYPDSAVRKVPMHSVPIIAGWRLQRTIT
jgi:WD40 repeat protein